MLWLLAWVLVSDRSLAAGVRDVDDGWLMGPAGVAAFLGTNTGPSAGLWSTVGYTRLYSLNEVPITRIELGYRLAKTWGAPTVAISWQGLGEGLYREQNTRLHLQWGNPLALGLAGTQVLVESGGGEFELQRLSSWDLRATGNLLWQLAPRFEIRAEVWLPLAASEDSLTKMGRRRLGRLQGWHEQVSFGLTVDLKPTLQPTVGLEWDLAWGSAAMGLRLDPSTAVVGPVVYVSHRNILIQTSHLVHPQLGVTHRFQIGVGHWGAARW